MSDVWPTDRPVALGENAATVTDRIAGFVLRDTIQLWWIGALVLCLPLLGMLVVASFWVLFYGVGIWGLGWPVFWGLADIDYDWFVEIATGAMFVSAAGHLFRQDWRPGISRFAEAVGVCGIVGAGLAPILHLGRQGFFYWLYPYPNNMAAWPQFRSPLEWDFFNIQSFAACAVLFFYFGLVPDFATLRDRAGGRVKQIAYGALALGFRGSGAQWRRYRATYTVLAAIMFCSSILMAGVGGLDLSGAQVVGWHSTQVPMVFAFNAVLTGTAMVLFLVAPLRRLMGMEAYITDRHLDMLCRILLAACLCFTYTWAVEAFNTFYGSDAKEKAAYLWRMTGPYAPTYWLPVVFDLLLPQVFWIRPLRRFPLIILPVCLAVLVGTYIYHYSTVVTYLERTHLPSAWGSYHGDIWDWLLLFGLIGLFFTAFLIFVRLLPMIPMHAMRILVRRVA